MTKKEIKAKLKAIIKAEKHGNGLKKDIARDWLNALPDYEDGTGWIKDLMNGGCGSGFIGKLIYTTDARKYYDKHYEDIEEVISDFETSTGTTADAMNRNGIDHKNFRAWVGYEEMARIVSDKIGIEI